jgi:formylglycine-generating enzyme required for sulfatase activity
MHLRIILAIATAPLFSLMTVCGQDVPPAQEPPDGMVWIPTGTFKMGSETGPADGRPIHEVEVDGFWIDETEVTNAEFARFVEVTGYVTVAERKPDPKDFPGVPAEQLVPGAVVFSAPPGPVSLDNALQWWRWQPGASWRHPSGPGSSIEKIMDHPVVQVCWEDAAAYAKWADKRLPSEAEWERAARGGVEAQTYVWGNEKHPGGKWMANVFSGEFPQHNTNVDGHEYTSPVKSFPPNAFGLYDMSGNVWEWTADWYRPDYYTKSPAKNPQGPADSHDPDEPQALKKVTRGGSFLCTDEYCIGYQPGIRGKTSIDTGLQHTGFRCVKSP